jgi:hypothetical protein
MEQLSPARRRRALAAGTVSALVAALLAFVAAPAFGASAVYPKGVGIDLGPEPTSYGLTAHVGDVGTEPVVGEAEGRGYWQTDKATGAVYLYFDVADDFVVDAGTEVVIALDHLAPAAGSIVLQYDGAGGGFVDAPRYDYEAAEGWQPASFLLPDARLTDRTNGADFRIGIEGAGISAADNVDLAIASVRVLTVGTSVDLGANVVADGIAVRPGDDTAIVTGETGGEDYWQTNRASTPNGTLYIYANVSDTYANAVDGDRVLVSVDYLDEGGAFNLQYDSPGSTIPDMFKNSPTFQTGTSGEWRRHTFVLDDAVMTNRSNGSDFRLAVQGDVEVKVSKIRVTVVPTTLEPKSGLVALLSQATLALGAARVGDRDGQYPQQAVDTLSHAVTAGQAVVDDPDAGGQQIADATTALTGALAGFRAARVSTSFADEATASASSTEPGRSPADAIDGDTTSTRWASGIGGAGEWFRLDFGQPRTFDDVRIVWEAAYSKAYAISVSDDGAHWTPVAQATASGPGTVTTRFAPATARYLQVELTGYAPEIVNFSFFELEVRNRELPATQPFIAETAYPTRDLVVADIDAVRDFDADETGEHDATAAIQDALDACTDLGGGTVWLPAGRYLVTDTIEVGAFCSLRGDRRDPDTAGDDYGTLIVADLPSGDASPSLFRIGGSAGVSGVTTWYPEQDAADPVPFGYTFELPGRAWIGEENYMVSTVEDVTMLNSYRGIGVSTMRSDRGTPARDGQVHEVATVRGIRGTVLYEGAVAFNGADVGTWEDIRFDNGYWAGAGSAFGAPERTVLDAWTRAHGTGLTLGDLEWDQFTDVAASDYAVGIHIVKGQRASFTGSFLDARIERAGTAVLVDDIDTRWGVGFAGGVLEGDHAVRNLTGGYVKLTDVDVRGATEGTVHVLDGEVGSYEPQPDPEPVDARLFVATDAPYSAPRGFEYIPEQDATPALQSAIDAAAAAGGGLVYVPAGWYRVSGRLDVPAGVELRGSSSVPTRDQNGASRGTVLLAYEGRDSATADTDPAFLTLSGTGAAVAGIRVFYPENNPATGLVPYPATVRGTASDLTIRNLGLSNSWNAVDLSSDAADGFLVRKVLGLYLDRGVTVGANEGGRIEGLLSNGNAILRTGFNLPGWDGIDLFAQVIDPVSRVREELVQVDGATDLQLHDVFAYGTHSGLVVTSGDVRAFNLGTDNLGTDGYSVDLGGGTAEAVNVMRYNGATARGIPTLWNVMGIGMTSNAVTATAPAEGPTGTVRIVGNEVEPGRYERGSTIALTVEPAAGARFTGWVENGEVVGTDPRLDLTVAADRSFTATFAVDDGATAAPGVGVLTALHAKDRGKKAGDFEIRMDLRRGENASEFRLYQNGTLVKTVPLTMNTPKAQSALVTFRGLSAGTYEYTGVLVNSRGETAVKPVTVNVSR